MDEGRRTVDRDAGPSSSPNPRWGWERAEARAERDENCPMTPLFDTHRSSECSANPPVRSCPWIRRGSVLWSETSSNPRRFATCKSRARSSRTRFRSCTARFTTRSARPFTPRLCAFDPARLVASVNRRVVSARTRIRRTRSKVGPRVDCFASHTPKPWGR